MIIVLSNASDSPRRRGWIDCAVPYSKVVGQSRWWKSSKCFAYRGRIIGDMSAIMHVYTTMQPREQIRLEFQPADIDPNNARAVPTFAPSSWVVDDVAALIPRPVIQLERNGPLIEMAVQDLKISVVEKNPVLQVFHGRTRVPNTMFVFDTFMYVRSGEESIPLEWMFTCSDPRTKALTQHFNALGVVTGELVEVMWHDHYKLADPTPTADGKGWVHVLAKHRSLGEGQQILHWGTMLAVPQKNIGAEILKDDFSIRRDSLVAQVRKPGASLGGSMRGVAAEWEGNWGVFGAVPQVDGPFVGNAFSMLSSFRAYIAGQGDMYAVKPWNLVVNAGDTGDQEDFGAVKGSAVVSLGEPELIERYLYSVNEHLRGFHFREEDGSPILFKNHPDLRTWSQEPFGRVPQGTDSLGKDFVAGGYWPRVHGTSWTGEDDQHRSMNNLLAAYWLTGSYALRMLIADFLEMDLAQVENRLGAPRAVGRLFLAWAGMLRSMDSVSREKLLAHVETRMSTVCDFSLGNTVSGPIKPIMLGTDPSFWEGDQKVKAWIVWEHAITAIGMYGMARVLEGGSQVEVAAAARYKEKAMTYSEMVTNYGVYYDGTNWRCCTAVRWLDDGQAVAPEQYYDGSPDCRTLDSFWDFGTLSAILIAEKITEDAETRNRAHDIIIHHGSAKSWRQAEWRAI